MLIREHLVSTVQGIERVLELQVSRGVAGAGTPWISILGLVERGRDAHALLVGGIECVLHEGFVFGTLLLGLPELDQCLVDLRLDLLDFFVQVANVLFGGADAARQVALLLAKLSPSLFVLLLHPTLRL